MSEACAKLDQEKFSALFQDYYLRRPDGKLSNERATPAALQPLLLMLLVWTEQMEAEWKSLRPHHPTLQPQLNAAVNAWYERLYVYLEVVDACIAQGRGNDPSCCYYTVTAPLLLGWYPNEAGDGIDPKQVSPKVLDVGSPMSLAVQLCELGKFHQFHTPAQFFSDALQNFEDSLGPGWQIAKSAGERAWQCLQDPMTCLQKSVDTLKKLSQPSPLMLGAAIVLGLGVLAFYAKR